MTLGRGWRCSISEPRERKRMANKKIEEAIENLLLDVLKQDLSPEEIESTQKKIAMVRSSAPDND